MCVYRFLGPIIIDDILIFLFYPLTAVNQIKSLAIVSISHTSVSLQKLQILVDLKQILMYFPLIRHLVNQKDTLLSVLKLKFD